MFGTKGGLELVFLDGSDMHLLKAALLSTLAFQPAFAQIIAPTSPVVVYDSAPTGLFQQSVPVGLLSDQGQQTLLYSVAPGVDGSGYTVGAQIPTQSGDLSVIGTQDVLQGFSNKRWLQIGLGGASSHQTGWVLCGETDDALDAKDQSQPCSNFKLKQ